MEKVARKNAWEEDVVYGFTTSGEHGATSAEQLSYKDLWLGFKGRTTAHGVSPIADARGMLLFTGIVTGHNMTLKWRVQNVLSWNLNDSFCHFDSEQQHLNSKIVVVTKNLLND